MPRIALIVMPLIVGLISPCGYSEIITVAVASNFTAPMREIVVKFEAKSGHKVEVAYGSSGKIFTQINHGAPYQAFFSADQEKPAALIDKGLAFPDTRFTYAIGKLALWSTSAIASNELKGALKENNFRKLALANPKLAPYGSAAVEVLENLHLLQATQAKWVVGENIAQTFQFVATGNADMGFVALAQILTLDKNRQGSMWIVPLELHNPIRQDAVLLRAGEHSVATREFLQFVNNECAAIISTYGYDVPNG